MQRRYEIQVLDSYGRPLSGANDGGAIYALRNADLNAAVPLGKWETYDITFRAARWVGNIKVANAEVTVYWNGSRVQNNIQIPGPTGGGDIETASTGAILLQNLGSLVRFRNVWVLPLQQPGFTEVCQNTFSTQPGPEWSRTNLSLTPVGGRRFLGTFSNEVPRLSLTNLPPHTAARVSFDLFVLRSWDGNGDTCCGPDVWSLREEGGQTLLQTTFSNTGSSANRQSYPGAFTQRSEAAGTGATEVNTLGYQYPSTGGAVRDSVYHISIPFNHSGDTLALLFSAARLQGLTNESWGLDNVAVELGNDFVPPSSSSAFAVKPGAIWKYLDNGSDQGVTWRSPSFNDSSWASGPAELGYGDNNGTEQRPEATLLSFGPNANAKYITTYFRHAFAVSNVWAITNLTLGLMRDDGAVVYLK